MPLLFVFLAATAWVAAIAPARAEPISAAIASAALAAGASAGVASTLGALGSAVAGIAVSLGLSTLASVLSPKPKAGESLSGVETSLQLGGDVARQIATGRVLAKGQLVYVNTWGYANTFLDQIFVLSDWRSKGLVSVTINGTKNEPLLNAEGPGWKNYVFLNAAGQLYITFYDGTQTTADPAYIASSNPSGRWTANSILTGLTYVEARFVYVKDAALYENGIPDLSFEFDGALLYDRRKDSTAGGFGTHRWADPATWEFSANPVVIAENYLRGFHLNSERILGMGVPAYDLVGESWVAAANICDEAVTLDAGGTEPRYRCASILTADEGVQHRQVLDTLLSTFAGYLYDYGGSYVCQAGAAQSPVRTVTDADLVMGNTVTFAAKRSRADLVNAIHGQFLDPASGYQPQSYGAQISAGGEAADGEELGKALDLMAVPSQAQAERIAKVRLREARAQASATITLGFNHVDLQVGDWLTWASARFGTRTWRITDRALDPATRAVSLTLAETNAAVFSWTAADEAPPPALRVRTDPGNRISTVSGFAVVAVASVSDDAGQQVPGLLCTWDTGTDENPFDPAIDTVEIEYRVVGSIIVSKATDATPEDGRIVIPGVLGETDYEARATIRTTPIRPTTWTAWVAVTTGDSFIRVSIDHLDEVIDEILTGAGPGSIGEAKQAGTSAFAHADAAFAHTDDAFAKATATSDDLTRSLSANPTTRALAVNPAKNIQGVLDSITETLAFVIPRFEQLRASIYGAGLTIVDGEAQIAGIVQAGNRLNTVSITLDAMKASISLLASSIVGGATDGAAILAQLTTVQTNLNALTGTVINKADQATVTTLGTQITAAQQSISALGTIVMSTVAGTLAADVALNSQTLTDVMAYLTSLGGHLGSTLATTQQVTGSRIDETGRAISETGKTLLAVSDRSTAQYTELVQAIASGDAAEVIARAALAAQVGSNLARLVAEETARATADSAITTSLAALSAQVNNASNGLPYTLARLITEESTRASQDAAEAALRATLSAQVNNVSTGLPATLARLITEENARTTADAAEASLRTALSAQVNDSTSGLPFTLARLIGEENARATQDTALSTALSGLSSQVNSSGTGLPATLARLVSEETTRAANDSALSSRATALESTVYNGTSGVVATYAAFNAFTSTQAGINSSLSSSIATNTANIGTVSGSVTAETSARIAGDNALSTALTAVDVKSNYGSASGQIALVATSGPAGTSAAYRMQLVANGAPAGITVLAMSDGTSRILLDATKVLFGDSSGGVTGFTYDSTTGTLSVANLIVTENLIAAGANAIYYAKIPTAGQFATGAGSRSGQIPGSVQTFSLIKSSVIDIQGLIDISFSVPQPNNIAMNVAIRIIYPDSTVASSIIFNTNYVNSGATGATKFSVRKLLPAGFYTVDIYYNYSSGSGAAAVAVQSGSNFDILLNKNVNPS